MALKNEAIVEQGRHWLSKRKEWEKQQARLDLVRHLEDRPKVRNYPFPRASNFAYALCDMMIDNWKPQLTGSLMARERLTNFTAISEKMVPLSSKLATYYDFQVRNFTNFKQEMKYAADTFCHSGMGYVRVTWDAQKGCPRYDHFPNLFLIRDPDSEILAQDPAYYRVLQLDTAFVKRHWTEKYGVRNIQKLIDRATSGRMEDEADEAGVKDQLYKRVGIDRTTDKVRRAGDEEDDDPEITQMVVHEYLYTDKNTGKKRLRTVSPDLPEFDLKDDRAYPYNHGHWLDVEFRREYKEKHAYTSRGWTELLAEPQAFLGAILRSVHNKMVMSQAPFVHAPDGLPEGVSQNFDLQPLQINPYKIEFLSPPGVEPEWFEQAAMMREYGEQRGKAPDFGLRQEPGQGSDARTKYELQKITEQNITQASSVLDNWDDGCRECLWQGWQLNVQFKPQNIRFLDGQQPGTLPEGIWDEIAQMQNEYVFSVASSAEILNKQLRLEKRMQIYAMSMGKPYAKEHNAFKYALEALDPDAVPLIYMEPAVAQNEDVKKALGDIGSIVQVGNEPQIDPSANHGVAAQTALAWLQNPNNLKVSDIKTHAAVIGWGRANAKMMAKADPEGAMMLDQAFQGIMQGMASVMAPMPMAGGNGNGKMLDFPGRGMKPEAPK